MMKKSTFTLSIAISLLFLLLLSGVAAAQDHEPTDDEVNAIAKQLYCPVCENIPLDVCPTQACVQWREIIRQKLAEGWTEDQIKQYFVDQYGDRVLATPPARGLNWLVYILPPAVFVVGAYLLFRVVRGWRQQAVMETPIASISPDDPYIARLEEELQKRDR
ncbi:MAG TPA: cytochrome c-type biogenesis protein CcmH [Anaerolineae bacterium]|nr:cytochrome c-type biogenesis protein CcmH [Anaerolineae bacterium]